MAANTAIIRLLDSNGKEKNPTEGESFNIQATFHDPSGDPIMESMFYSLKLTHYDENGKSINNRLAQDVLDANGGSVDTDGTYSQELDASDNPAISSTVTPGETVDRGIILDWSWIDLEGHTRTGRAERKYSVVKLTTISS